MYREGWKWQTPIQTTGEFWVVHEVNHKLSLQIHVNEVGSHILKAYMHGQLFRWSLHSTATTRWHTIQHNLVHSVGHCTSTNLRGHIFHVLYMQWNLDNSHPIIINFWFIRTSYPSQRFIDTYLIKTSLIHTKAARTAIIQTSCILWVLDLPQLQARFVHLFLVYFSAKTMNGTCYL